MSNIRSIKLQRLHGQLGEVVYQLTHTQFTSLTALQKWRPSINAYRCADCVTICVDLAGVDKSEIKLEVQPRRLAIRGRRHPPEPAGSEPKAIQVLAMEIDYGSFEREIGFSVDVDPDRVRAEQRNGLLWIHLPLRSP